MDRKIKVEVMSRKGHVFEVMLPSKFEVCWKCSGLGTIVNPNIGAFNPDEQDEEFLESYFAGHYDVKCDECEGQRVVERVDWEKLSPKMKERLERWMMCEAESEAEMANHRKLLERGIHS